MTSMYEVTEEGREQYEAWLAAQEEDEPIHRPIAPEAPIPGRQWYAGCEPDRPTVGPDGICRGCGARACPTCGHGFWPDGACACETTPAG